MAWTEADLQAICDAIAQGALKVKYQDKEITYHSLDDMLKAKQVIEQALGNKPRSCRVFAKSKKGTT